MKSRDRLLEAEKAIVFKKFLLGNDFKHPYHFMDKRARLLFGYAGDYHKTLIGHPQPTPSVDSFIEYLQGQPFGWNNPHDKETTVLDAVGGEAFVRDTLGGF